jgi:hypothetical protein
MKDNLDDIPMPHLLSIILGLVAKHLLLIVLGVVADIAGTAIVIARCFSIASHPWTIAHEERVLFDWSLRLWHKRPTLHFRMQKLGITLPQGACP